jgi:hypothetical protein
MIFGLASLAAAFAPGQGQRMQFSQLNRRKFISVAGGTAAWPLAGLASGRRCRVMCVEYGGPHREGEEP